MKVELGQRIRCKYTGLSGTAVKREQTLGNPVDTIGVQPDSKADSGELPRIEWVPENWLVPDEPKQSGYAQL